MKKTNDYITNKNIKLFVEGYSMKEEIGKKINEIRNNKGMTLKDLSIKTNLSISFLSQVERGLTSIAIVSLKNIVEALDTNLSELFSFAKKSISLVLKSYEEESFQYDKNNLIYSKLTRDIPGKDMEIMKVTLLPGTEDGFPEESIHKGEEFIYVLEGILTFCYEGQEYTLYPGDSSHYSSMKPHAWKNKTSKLTKIIMVIVPGIFDD